MSNEAPAPIAPVAGTQYFTLAWASDQADVGIRAPFLSS
jgi:hypothetical protein